MNTPKSTISEPQNSQNFFGLVDSTIAKVSFLSVVGFGCFTLYYDSHSVIALL